MSVYKSGAFLQQCFSVHPLSLDVKMVAPPESIGILCKNCLMRHRLTVQETVPASEESKDRVSQLALLHECFHGHPEEIRLCKVHIEHQIVEIRCRPCRRTYTLGVVLFETHHS